MSLPAASLSDEPCTAMRRQLRPARGGNELFPAERPHHNTGGRLTDSKNIASGILALGLGKRNERIDNPGALAIVFPQPCAELSIYS